MDADLSEMDLRRLRAFFNEYFDLEELRSLAFDVFQKYDHISNDTLDTFTREVLIYALHTGQVRDLIEVALERRPNQAGFLGLLLAKIPLSKDTRYILIVLSPAAAASTDLQAAVAHALDTPASTVEVIYSDRSGR